MPSHHHHQHQHQHHPHGHKGGGSSSIVSSNTFNTAAHTRSGPRHWSKDPKKCPHSDWTIYICNIQSGRRDPYYIHTKALDSLPEARLPYFEYIFSEKLEHTGNQESELVINDEIVARGFGILLDFLYASSSEEEEVLLNNVQRGMALFRVANYFNVAPLKKKLSSFYHENTLVFTAEENNKDAISTSSSAKNKTPMPKLFQKKTESPLDKFARSMPTVKYVEDEQLELGYFLDALSRRKALKLSVSPNESKSISCLVAMCAEHNKKVLARKLFYKLTHKEYIPHINQEAALQLLTIEASCRFWTDVEKFSSLQGRCIRSLLSDWAGLRRRFKTNEAYWKSMRQLSPNILGILLMHSSGTIQGDDDLSTVLSFPELQPALST